MCTFENCKHSEKLYVTRHDWIFHETQMHRRQWACRDCEVTFESRSTIEQHMRELHSGNFTENQLPILLDLCERAVDLDEDTDCPLCEKTLPLSSLRGQEDLQGHLAWHLEQIALFVIAGDDSDSETNDANSNQAMPGILHKVDEAEFQNISNVPSTDYDVDDVQVDQCRARNAISSLLNQESGPTGEQVQSQVQDWCENSALEEANYFARKTDERANIGEAYNGTAKDWAVPPSTERVKMDGVGDGSQVKEEMVKTAAGNDGSGRDQGLGSQDKHEAAEEIHEVAVRSLHEKGSVMEPFRIDPEITTSLHDMSNDDLRSFVLLQDSEEDSASDEQIEAMSQDHPDRAGRLNNLGNWLGTRFQRTDSMDDLNKAVDVSDMTVEATPQDHPDRASRLNNLGNRLGTRFEWTGSMDDLNKAIDVSDMAVEATPQDHPDRAGRLNNLGNRLGIRFEQTGSMDDLNKAVDVSDMAVEATPQDHPDRASYLNNLGNRLGIRFEQTGSMDDLNKAVNVLGMAVEAMPQDHPDRAGCLNNLGNWLGTRFQRTGSMDDLNKAVDVSDMAVKATPQDHPDRAGCLNNLGNWFATRFEWTGSMDDLNKAIDVSDMAVETTSQDHPDRAGRLNNLGNRLGIRFEQTGSMDDLNKAVNVLGMAVEATPQDHPDRAGCLNNLGNWLGTRFEQTSSMKDLNLHPQIGKLENLSDLSAK
jgi:tetratricopeptide (TPR) repeat protein